METLKELKTKMLNLLVEQAEILSKINAEHLNEMEPEQVRKNAVTILSIYQEVEMYYNEINQPDSNNSLADED